MGADSKAKGRIQHKNIGTVGIQATLGRNQDIFIFPFLSRNKFPVFCALKKKYGPLQLEFTGSSLGV